MRLPKTPHSVQAHQYLTLNVTKVHGFAFYVYSDNSVVLWYSMYHREDLIMGKTPETITVQGKTFDVPDFNMYCEEDETTHFFHEDDLPPFSCNDCGVKIPYVRSEPPIEGGFNTLA